MANGVVEQVILTADIILFRHQGQNEVLLIQREKEPFAGAYALPGGKMDREDSNIDATAIREAREETGIELAPDQLELTGIYSENHRDPRQEIAGARYVSVACAAFLEGTISVQAGDDAASAGWFPVASLDRMTIAFDHRKIIRHAYSCIFGASQDKPLI